MRQEVFSHMWEGPYTYYGLVSRGMYRRTVGGCTRSAKPWGTKLLEEAPEPLP